MYLNKIVQNPISISKSYRITRTLKMQANGHRSLLFYIITLFSFLEGSKINLNYN